MDVDLQVDDESDRRRSSGGMDSNPVADVMTKSSIGPSIVLDPFYPLAGNVTAALGKTASLSCRIRGFSNRTVRIHRSAFSTSQISLSILLLCIPSPESIRRSSRGIQSILVLLLFVGIPSVSRRRFF